MNGCTGVNISESTEDTMSFAYSYLTLINRVCHRTRHENREHM